MDIGLTSYLQNAEAVSAQAKASGDTYRRGIVATRGGYIVVDVLAAALVATALCAAFSENSVFPERGCKVRECHPQNVFMRIYASTCVKEEFYE